MANGHALTLTKLKIMIRATIREELGALLQDPDFGKTIAPWVERRLQHTQKKPQKLFSAKKVLGRL